MVLNDAITYEKKYSVDQKYSRVDRNYRKFIKNKANDFSKKLADGDKYTNPFMLDFASNFYMDESIKEHKYNDFMYYNNIWDVVTAKLSINASEETLHNYVSSKVKEELENIDSVYDAKKFIEKYGTHVKTSALFGGQLQISYAATATRDGVLRKAATKINNKIGNILRHIIYYNDVNDFNISDIYDGYVYTSNKYKFKDGNRNEPKYVRDDFYKILQNWVPTIGSIDDGPNTFTYINTDKQLLPIVSILNKLNIKNKDVIKYIEEAVDNLYNDQIEKANKIIDKEYWYFEHDPNKYVIYNLYESTRPKTDIGYGYSSNETLIKYGDHVNISHYNIDPNKKYCISVSAICDRKKNSWFTNNAITGVRFGMFINGTFYKSVDYPHDITPGTNQEAKAIFYLYGWELLDDDGFTIRYETTKNNKKVFDIIKSEIRLIISNE